MSYNYANVKYIRKRKYLRKRKIFTKSYVFMDSVEINFCSLHPFLIYFLLAVIFSLLLFIVTYIFIRQVPFPFHLVRLKQGFLHYCHLSPLYSHHSPLSHLSSLCHLSPLHLCFDFPLQGYPLQPNK